MSSPPPSTVGVAQPRTWATHCCGCCCDMRTAVIVVNLVSIGLAAISLSALLTVTKVAGSFADDDAWKAEIDDDAAVKEMEEFFDEMAGTTIISPLTTAVLAIRLVASALGVYGAVQHKLWPVGVSLAAYGLEILLSIGGVNLIGLITASFFAYPHYFFMQELKDIQSGGGDASSYNIHTDAAAPKAKAEEGGAVV